MPRALIIVDFQNDFTPGGALPVPHGDEIAARIGQLVDGGGFDLVVATRDWHPPDHSSFAAQGGPWPVHCVAGMPGAQLHPALATAQVDLIVDKGRDRTAPGYSAFEGTALGGQLADRGIDELTICGLATDYCVRSTALDALRLGFRVSVDSAGVRGVDVHPGDSERALAELRESGVTVD